MYDCRCENKAASWRCDFNPFAFGNKRATSDRTLAEFCRSENGHDFLVLSSMMLFKRSFGFTRSLFILYVHEHDRLDFGMVETAVFDCIYWFSSRSVLSGRLLFGIGGRVFEGQDPLEWTWTRERKCKCCLLCSSGQRKYSSLFTMNEHTISNVYLYFSFLLRTIFVKNILLQISFYA